MVEAQVYVAPKETVPIVFWLTAIVELRLRA